MKLNKLLIALVYIGIESLKFGTKQIISDDLRYHWQSLGETDPILSNLINFLLNHNIFLTILIERFFKEFLILFKFRSTLSVPVVVYS